MERGKDWRGERGRVIFFFGGVEARSEEEGRGMKKGGRFIRCFIFLFFLFAKKGRANLWVFFFFFFFFFF